MEFGGKELAPAADECTKRCDDDVRKPTALNDDVSDLYRVNYTPQVLIWPHAAGWKVPNYHRGEQIGQIPIRIDPHSIKRSANALCRMLSRLYELR